MKEDKRTCFREIKHIVACIGLAIFLISIAFPASIGFAQKGFEGEIALPEYYPKKFIEQGLIDRIAPDEVVINDCLFKLSLDIEYHTPTVQNASSAWFKAGKFVGYITNSKREIVSLWLIE